FHTAQPTRPGCDRAIAGPNAIALVAKWSNRMSAKERTGVTLPTFSALASSTHARVAARATSAGPLEICWLTILLARRRRCPTAIGAHRPRRATTGGEGRRPPPRPNAWFAGVPATRESR